MIRASTQKMKCSSSIPCQLRIPNSDSFETMMIRAPPQKWQENGMLLPHQIPCQMKITKFRLIRNKCRKNSPKRKNPARKCAKLGFQNRSMAIRAPTPKRRRKWNMLQRRMLQWNGPDKGATQDEPPWWPTPHRRDKTNSPWSRRRAWSSSSNSCSCSRKGRGSSTRAECCNGFLATTDRDGGNCGAPRLSTLAMARDPAILARDARGILAQLRAYGREMKHSLQPPKSSERTRTASSKSPVKGPNSDPFLTMKILDHR